ncbi:MAG: heme-binding protein [Planctomycetaceae bacterium]|nr:heme-binding protein [Planctomycetaceae bacterium]
MTCLSGSVRLAAALICLQFLFCDSRAMGQTLQEQLRTEGSANLAKAARAEGDPQRGALIFHQPLLACAKCHTGEFVGQLGPDLAKPESGTTAERLIEAVLEPSKLIRKGFEPQTIQTIKGETLTGFLVEESELAVVLRDLARNGAAVTIPKSMIDERAVGRVSVMPADQANQLANRQQFLDLIRYLIEIAEGGPDRATQLKPPASLLVLQIPEYEKEIDHAGMIRDWNPASFKRGEAIYTRLCINCHGTADQPGSLPTSLKFATGTFKNGSDPYRLYLTLTHGYGLMAPQTWMVPVQKYDVVHYLREAYLKPRNAGQYTKVDNDYLAKLPKGKERGPAPSNVDPWSSMNYGAFLTATYEVPEPKSVESKENAGPNIAQKGIAVRLDSGPGGVARGRNWMVFDHDTLKMTAAWNQPEIKPSERNSSPIFIDWNGINFNGRHQVHPNLSGQVQVSDRASAGWANPLTDDWKSLRTVGRDGRHYGPLPKTWGHYRGLYQCGERVVFSYAVGETSILEQPGMSGSGLDTIYTRTFEVGPRTKDLVLSIGTHPNSSAQLATIIKENGLSVVHPNLAVIVPPAITKSSDPVKTFAFSGAKSIRINRSQDFDMTDKDYQISVRFRTREGGTLFSQAAVEGPWTPNAKALFIRGGKLCFDIGWVGVVTSRKRVDDGVWHDAFLTWKKSTGEVEMRIDDTLIDAKGILRPHKAVPEYIVRLGFAAPDFPEPAYFKGDIEEVSFYQSAAPDTPINFRREKDLIGKWQPMTELKSVPAPPSNRQGRDAMNSLIRPSIRQLDDLSGKNHFGSIEGTESQTSERETAWLVAGVAGKIPDKRWQYDRDAGLQLRIPEGKETLRFTVGFAQQAAKALGDRNSVKLEDVPLDWISKLPVDDLTSQLHGGPRRWPEILTTDLIAGRDSGPFAVDILSAPVSNPWLCQMRLTGFDFFADGNRMAVSAWDGDVWLVSGFKNSAEVADAGKNQPSGGAIPAGKLTWQRIASGLFQPLGVKIVNDQIYVTCRDQIVILRDLNGDQETDFYECFNSDHQVTEHFHEFAMGLQRDAAGNFYYAKSARHALPAVVPHHGTLLRVSPDGSKTDIVANGFRAANGVCLNPDGTFFVTDQEGHWNPKNRINWVKEGGFYGNMFGYHNVTDASDAAMLPPLCWITNAFDRSPSELLWVNSDRWGPLKGALLNFSYGYGKVFIVPHEILNGQAQGGMCELPLPTFPTGIMRGRFNPSDGQLYVCGMFAWAGSAVQPGGLYRIRYTGQPVYVPVKIEAVRTGIKLKMTGELDAESVRDRTNYSIQTWSLKRTADYGSKHYDEKKLRVTAARLDRDGQTIWLEIPEIQPTWCMEIRYSLRSKTGAAVNGTIHNTIHRLGEQKPAAD